MISLEHDVWVMHMNFGSILLSFGVSQGADGLINPV